MTETLKQIAELMAIGIEVISVLVIVFASIQALVRLLAPLAGKPAAVGWKKDIWVFYGMWLMLGLQFQLAADIVHSAIEPTWESLGHLAAIAVIRTFLNYFLEQDIAKLAKDMVEKK